MKPRECVSMETQKEKCQRCGDLFYDPKTMIKDARQAASEWESIAKELEAKLQYEKDALAAAIEHIENLVSKNEDLEAKLRIAVEALDMIGGRNLESWGAMYENIAEAALKKIRG